MKNTKQVLARILAVFIIFMAFFTPMYDAFFAYADNTTDNWQSVTTNQELVEAFRYYCKSRDITFEGSAADAITSFTTQTFNSICNGLGIDVTALQAHLKKETDGSNIRFLFDSTGITAYNRIFSQFLQDNELDVGDTDVNKTVYNGHYYTYNNNTALCFEGVSSTSFLNISYLTIQGTPFKYDNLQLRNLINSGSSNVIIEFDSTHIYNAPMSKYVNGDGTSYSYLVGVADANTNYRNSNYTIYYINNGTLTYLAYPCIYYNNGNYYSRRIVFDPINNKYRYEYMSDTTPLNNQPSNSGTTNIIIVSNTINNNNYEGDTIINNYGTPSEPTNPDTPDDPTPDDPEPPETDPPDWGIDWPDLNIDWILAGKENKFPFDIPFNVMFALSLLNAEPQTPELQGTLDLGVYQWEYDLSLEQFDDIAATCRNIEFLAFLIGLMLMTKKLIWG